MKLDGDFVREVRKKANGDGSREARFAFIKEAKEARKKLSTPEVRRTFWECIKEYGRVPVAICVGATIIERRDRLKTRTVRWATSVLELWTNKPYSGIAFAHINDNLHPTRIEEYAGEFMRLTTEEP